MKVLNTEITRDGAPYLIGEIGSNHSGDAKRALQMMSTLKAAGFHAAKLQKRTNKEMYTRKLLSQGYEGYSSYGATYGQHRGALELGRLEFQELIDWGREIDLHLFATAFDPSAANFLEGLDMPAYKMASGDIVNTPLLKHVAAFGKPMFVSTGGATMDDVKRAYDAIMPINEQLCIMHCTASYPCPPVGDSFEVFNMRAISVLRSTFHKTVIGFSDHQNGISLGPVGLALGARVFEKHVTFDRAAKGTDHPFSLEPVGQRKYARDIQRTYEAMGDGKKQLYECEKAPLRKMAKSIVAKSDILSGTILTMNDITFKCPAGGLPPYHVDDMLGQRTKKHIVRDQMILWRDLE